jgi:hypothetical protein
LRGVSDRFKTLVPYSKRISSVKYYDKHYPTFLRGVSAHEE